MLYGAKKSPTSVGPNVWTYIDPTGLSSFIFRGDDFYRVGDSIGLPIGSEADIKDPLAHVSRASKGETSIYTSFAETRKNAMKFTNKGNVLKVSKDELKVLANEGKIKVVTTGNVAEEMEKMGFSKKKIKAVQGNMKRNKEILIEGEIPGKAINKC